MIKVGREGIPIDEIVGPLRHPDAGAVISYLGTVRSYLEDKQSQGLSFDVEDSVMYDSLRQVERDAIRKFDIKAVAIVHRTGSFAVGDDILLIAISSGHRGPAFDACQYIIDRIKELHDIWKEEYLHN